MFYTACRFLHPSVRALHVLTVCYSSFVFSIACTSRYRAVFVCSFVHHKGTFVLSRRFSWLLDLGLSSSILANLTNQAAVKLLNDLVWLSNLGRLHGCAKYRSVGNLRCARPVLFVHFCPFAPCYWFRATRGNEEARIYTLRNKVCFSAVRTAF